MKNSVLQNEKRNKNNWLVILAMSLFVIFNIAGLYLNYLLSWRIEGQAVGINLAGRQRMLSQRMVKVLLQFDNARRSGEPSDNLLKELKLTFDLFDNTLQGFNVGHETRGGANEVIFLPPVDEFNARKTVHDAVELWKDYRSKVAALLQAGDKIDTFNLQPVLADAQTHNLKLLGLMNTLTTELEMQTQREAQRIRFYQAVALLLALVSFIYAFVLIKRRDREIISTIKIAEEATRKLELDSAIKSYLVELSAELHQAVSLSEFARKFMHHVTQRIEVEYGVFYVFDQQSQRLIPAGGHGALTDEMDAVDVGQGLIGQCAQSRMPIVIADSTDVTVRIGAGVVTLKSIMLLPVIQADHLLGVIALAALQPIDTEKQSLLKELLPMVAMNLELLNRNLGTQRLVWGNQYRLGFKEIDDQHQVLVNMIGVLSDSIRENRGHEKLGVLLDELINYTVYHFNMEEELMQTHAYPESAAHCKAHEDLKRLVTDLQRKFMDGEATVTFQTVQLLNDWLSHHILKVDRHLVNFLKTKS